MPLAGQTRPDFVADSTQEERAFAMELRRLVDAMHPSKQSAKAALLSVRPSTLSCYRAARRMPRLVALGEIHRVASSAAPPGTPLPELADLRDLWKRAALRRQNDRLRKQASQRDVSAATVTARISQQDQAVPSRAYAVPPVPDRQEEMAPVRDRRLNDSWEKTPAAPQAAQSATVRSMLTAITTHRAAGRRQDVLGIIWAAGGSLTAHQLVEAADALRELKYAQLEGGLLHSASRRPTADVMRIATELITLGRPETAGTILSAAAAH